MEKIALTLRHGRVVVLTTIEVRCSKCGKLLGIRKVGGQWLQIKCPRCDTLNEAEDILTV